jgi:uncharacterized protein (DUF1810 family)
MSESSAKCFLFPAQRTNLAENATCHNFSGRLHNWSLVKFCAMTTKTKLAEFVAAQNDVYDEIRRELMAGKKKSHWIWFIFPQMAGLGFSFMSQKFGIASRTEAEIYLKHKILGSRLRECTELMLSLPDQDVSAILDYPDDLKFKSSMTLFAAVAPEEPLFKAALDKFFGGEVDQKTLDLLEKADQC